MKPAVSVAVLGAAGRMGRTIVRLLLDRSVEGLELRGALEADPAVLGRDAGTVAGCGECGVKIVSNMADAAAEADVLIDFTQHEASVKHAQTAAEMRKPIVIGTTGLDESDMAEVRKSAQQIPVVLSPNMSLGVNLLFLLVKEVARALKDKNYDVEIVEFHHRRKKDSPSGTALKLAEEVAAGCGWNPQEVLCFGRKGIVGERPRAQIGIHAVRGGDIVGQHTVVFAGEGESLSLRHQATSRNAFGMGALRAALWIVGKPPGLYGMGHVLGLEE